MTSRWGARRYPPTLGLDDRPPPRRLDPAARCGRRARGRPRPPTRAGGRRRGPGPATPTAGSCSCAARCPASGCGSRSPSGTRRCGPGRGWSTSCSSRRPTGSSRPCPHGGRRVRGLRPAARRARRPAGLKVGRGRRRAAPPRAASTTHRCVAGPPLPPMGVPHHGAGRRRRRPGRVPARTTSHDVVVPDQLPGRPPAARRAARRRRLRRGHRGRRCGSARPRGERLAVVDPTADGVVAARGRARGRGRKALEAGRRAGSTTRSPVGGGASRPARSSRPAPTAPRPWSTPWPGPAGDDAGRVPGWSDAYAGVGLFAGQPARRDAPRRRGRARPRRWSSSGRRRRSPTPATTSRTSTPGWSRPIVDPWRPVAGRPGRGRSRPAPASGARAVARRWPHRRARCWCW